MTGRPDARTPIWMRPGLGLASALLLIPLPASGQNNAVRAGSTRDVNQVIADERFTTPPPGLAEAVTAPRHLNVSLTNANADKTWFIDEISDGPVTMAVFSQPFDELGGLFIDFAANRNRTLTIRNNVGIQLISATDGSAKQIQIPDGARVSNPKWSPDGKSIAYYAHFPDGTHVFVADAASGRSRQLTRTHVLATLVTDFEWTADSRSISTVLVRDGRAERPVVSNVPMGPRIKVAEEADRNMLRTYASLMATPHDQALLEFHATGQVALIEVGNRNVQEIGQPAMVRSLSVAPDGRHVRVTRMLKPFSYIVPVNNFASVEEIWDTSGKALAEVDKEDLNVGVRANNLPSAPGAGGGDGDQQGKREVTWRPDGSLTYLEQEPAPEGEDSAAAQPAGEQGEEDRARRTDRLIRWVAPFDDASRTTLYEQDTRMQGHRFSENGEILFFSERSGQNTSEIAVILNQPTQKHTLARYRNEDFYANPGNLVTAGGAGGGGRGGRGGGGGSGPVTVSADGQSVFFQGTQYDKNPEAVAPKAFIDRVNIRTGDKSRVWESNNNGVTERISEILDIDAGSYIVSREAPAQVTQSYRVANGQSTQLTHNRDLFPDLTSAQRHSFIVARPDGFKFKVNVTLPADYQQGTRLPAMFWFYPREYTDQEDYDETGRTFNKYAFQNFGTRSIQFLVRLGYAVVEPDAPIIGNEGAMNNNYENDLRNNLAVVIDSVERRGWVDRGRIGIGGHSYGAFSTVNAMVHTPFFKAGIAGDGNYNRTLTPLMFQSERRILWDAKDVYLSMSPFLFAPNLTGALLMYHGMHDQNVGTDPTHSPRLFHALNGLGKTVSMYLYPFEDHGPATLETQLDLWARWAAWLDKYVKNPQPSEQKVTTDGVSGSSN
ncbi:MAG: S9 family peptidase [Longimicrobiales bacterium]